MGYMLTRVTVGKSAGNILSLGASSAASWRRPYGAGPLKSGSRRRTCLSPGYAAQWGDALESSRNTMAM